MNICIDQLHEYKREYFNDTLHIQAANADIESDNFSIGMTPLPPIMGFDSIPPNRNDAVIYDIGMTGFCDEQDASSRIKKILTWL